jgi:hypothetical protein
MKIPFMNKFCIKKTTNKIPNSRMFFMKLFSQTRNEEIDNDMHKKVHISMWGKRVFFVREKVDW